jgi:hypothetical protein
VVIGFHIQCCSSKRTSDGTERSNRLVTMNRGDENKTATDAATNQTKSADSHGEVRVRRASAQRDDEPSRRNWCDVSTPANIVQ